MSREPLLTRASWVTLGTAVIVVAVWTLLRPLKRQADRIEMFWSDWSGTPARPGRDAVPGVMDRLASIDGELQRNGGNSLKDRVIGNSRKIDYLSSQIDQIKSEAHKETP